MLFSNKQAHDSIGTFYQTDFIVQFKIFYKNVSIVKKKYILKKQKSYFTS